jgi:cyanophycinase
MGDTYCQNVRGKLLIIGGDEDREGDMLVLKRFVTLCGATDQHIAVITAASERPSDVWETYRKAFESLGAAAVTHVRVDAREQAADEKLLRHLADANGIFLTGGDQKRLLEMIGHTPVHAELDKAYRRRGACIAGTSAGASALTRTMLAEGQTELEPVKGAITLAEGLSLVDHIIVDQHFAERQRLPRLLSILAEHPELYGVGIDADTAMLLTPDGGIEVIGNGAVTILDGRAMSSNIAELKDDESPRLLNVRLHILPTGTTLTTPDGAAGSTLQTASDWFDQILAALASDKEKQS